MAYCMMVLFPEEADPVRAPSQFPVRTALAKIKTVQELANFTYGGTGEFWMEVIPAMNNCFKISIWTVPAAITQYTSAQFNIVGAVNSADSTTSANNVELYRSDVANYGLKNNPELYQAATSANFVWAFNIGCGATSAGYTYYGYFHADDGSAAELSVQMAYYKSAAWTTLSGTLVLSESANNGITWTVPLNATAIAFLFSTNENISGEVYLSAFPNGSAYLGWQPTTSGDTFQIFDTALQTQVSGLQGWKVTAQSLYLTFEGSSLNDNGKIVSSRVPLDYWGIAAGVTDISGALYNSMMALPFERYDGPIKHGTHCHWVPTTPSDVSMKTIGTMNNTGVKMMASGSWNQTQQARVQVTTVLEYTTTNTAIATEYAPPAPQFAWVNYLLAAKVPACTSNKDHVVAKVQDFVSNALRQGYQWVKAHPEYVFHAIESMAALAV